MTSNLEKLVREVKRESASGQRDIQRRNESRTNIANLETTEGLRESLQLLIERDNPMSDAARKALERL